MAGADTCEVTRLPSGLDSQLRWSRVGKEGTERREHSFDRPRAVHR